MILHVERNYEIVPKATFFQLNEGVKGSSTAHAFSEILWNTKRQKPQVTDLPRSPTGALLNSPLQR